MGPNIRYGGYWDQGAVGYCRGGGVRVVDAVELNELTLAALLVTSSRQSLPNLPFQDLNLEEKI